MSGHIEVQLRAGNAYVNRSVYYLARLYSDQLLLKFSPTRPERLRMPFERWLYVLRFADLYKNLARLPENFQDLPRNPGYP